MSRTLSPRTIEVVLQTAPVLQTHAEALTRLFYTRMFEHNPEVRPFFNPAHQASGRQQRALAGAIVAYATHIDRLAALGPAVELIAHKHASLGVLPEHYPIVGENLLAAIAELLGEAATGEILTAWGEAYEFLAAILIGREGELYAQHAETHGWQGFRRFRVAERVDESAAITSFHLLPVDGRPVGSHRPGQYLTVRAPDPDTTTTMRNYSISSRPDPRGYRISVKRESSGASPAGRISNWLHDQVRVGDEIEVGPPCGEFVFDPGTSTRRPLVLIAGGVGVTPLLSMLHAAVDAEVDREIVFIQAARNGRVRAFADEIGALSARHPRLRTHVCYDEPTAEDRAAAGFDTEGRVDLSLLQRLLEGPDAEFYVCGPPGFIATVDRALKTWGVDAARIHFEMFGPLEPPAPDA